MDNCSNCLFIDTQKIQVASTVFQPNNLWDACAMLYQLSYEASHCEDHFSLHLDLAVLFKETHFDGPVLWYLETVFQVVMRQSDRFLFL